MGLFERLSKEGRAKSALARQIKKVANKHSLSQDRFAAMEKLRENGSEEAITGLVRRFSYVYDKTIEDEQEKEWVFDVLVNMGERAVDPVRRYALSADTLSWPLRVLERIAPTDRMLAIVDELIEREPPEYTRDPTRKLQIMTWLGEWRGAPDEAIARRLLPYVGDFDETVRYTSIDTLSRHKHEETARLPLLDALVRPEEESRRIKVRIAEVLADAGWTVTDRKEAVSRLLADELPEFGMQHDKLVRKGVDRRR